MKSRKDHQIQEVYISVTYTPFIIFVAKPTESIPEVTQANEIKAFDVPHRICFKYMKYTLSTYYC